MADLVQTEAAERIQKRAHELFMQYGLRSVSMDDIASSLGISKKTIYQYFEDKDQLVDAVISGVILHNHQCCERDHLVSNNAVHEMFLAMDFMAEIFSRMNNSVLFDMQKYHPLSFEKFLKHKNEYLYQVIRQNIARGIQEGLYREDLPQELMARFRVESMMIPFDPRFSESVRMSLVDIHSGLTMHFLHGLVNEAGLQLITQYINERAKNKIS